MDTTQTTTAADLVDLMVDLDYRVARNVAHPREVTGLCQAIAESWLHLGNANRTEGAAHEAHVARAVYFHGVAVAAYEAR